MMNGTCDEGSGDSVPNHPSVDAPRRETARQLVMLRPAALRLAVAAVMTGLLVAALGQPGLGQPATTSTPAPTQLGLASPDVASFAAAKNAGARTVKILADWSVLEARRGEFTWADIDRAVAAAAREGLAPVVVLAYTPRWASLGTGADLTRHEIYSRQPPRDVRDWDRFVGEIAGRFRGRISEWQVWTQVGLPLFRGTGSEYLSLVQAARVRLRAVDPNARVVLAAPSGVDLAFLTRVLAEAPGAFDTVALNPHGFSPESLLRPLGILNRRMRGAGKTIWVEWSPEAAGPEGAGPGMAGAGGRAPGEWARMLGVSQATGVERLFAADTARIDGDLRGIGALLAARPYVGFLVRDPDVFAVVYGSAADAVLVAWSTADGRALDVPAGSGLRVNTLEGQPVSLEARDGKTSIRLSPAPRVISGIPAALVDEARATAVARGPLLPTPSADHDFSRSTEVVARLGRANEEHGLYNQSYRSRRNGAVEPVDVGGVEAVQTNVARQVIYVYFDIDDTFLYFVEGRIPVEITIEVWGARAPRQVGFNLLYDSTTGYRFTPWQWVDVRDGWVSYTIRLTDANVANTWGWDFAINTSGNRAEDLTVRSVTVRKGAR